jgi:hypothetical protein
MRCTTGNGGKLPDLRLPFCGDCFPKPSRSLLKIDLAWSSSSFQTVQYGPGCPSLRRRQPGSPANLFQKQANWEFARSATAHSLLFSHARLITDAIFCIQREAVPIDDFRNSIFSFSSVPSPNSPLRITYSTARCMNLEVLSLRTTHTFVKPPNQFQDEVYEPPVRKAHEQRTRRQCQSFSIDRRLRAC